jgi:hypothetical protein
MRVWQRSGGSTGSDRRLGEAVRTALSTLDDPAMNPAFRKNGIGYRLNAPRPATKHESRAQLLIPIPWVPVRVSEPLSKPLGSVTPGSGRLSGAHFHGQISPEPHESTRSDHSKGRPRNSLNHR